MILALLLAVQGFEERTLTTIPDGAHLGAVLSTPDGSAVAYALELGKTAHVIRGEWRSDAYLKVQPLALSGDGRHLLYHTCEEKKGAHRHQLRVDERVLQTFDVLKGETWRDAGALSRDASVAVFSTGHETERWWTYSVNGTNGTRHALSMLLEPRLSQDGTVFAGLATTPKDTYHVLLNDVLGPAYESVAGPAVSDNGVVAWVGEKEDDSRELRHGEKLVEFRGPMPRDLFISSDGKQLGFVQADDTGHFVKVGERRYPALKRIQRAAFNRDGTRVLFEGSDEERKPFVGVDERVFGLASYPRTPIVFSSDGAKIGYAALIDRDLVWKVIDLSK